MALMLRPGVRIGDDPEVWGTAQPWCLAVGVVPPRPNSHAPREAGDPGDGFVIAHGAFIGALLEPTE
jgi:hypothetical protein